MSGQPTEEKVVKDDTVKRYIHALQKPTLAFESCQPDVRTELVAMLKELLRHRDREHDAYWGEDDE